jgi:hypothetical protein
MSRPLTREQVAAEAQVVPPPRAPTQVDRSFELPAALYGATVACYLAFLGVLGVGLASPGLAIPMTIFVLFIFAGFGVPALWMRMGPDNPLRLKRWGSFRREGIATLTGPMSWRDATVQVLILPVLILLWAISVVTIAALV